MQFDKPGILAFSIALILGGINFLLLLGLSAISLIDIPFTHILAMAAASLVVAYVIIRYAVNQFIYDKIKVIYKNIHKSKVGTDKEESRALRSSGLDEVSREVAEWAEQRQLEINDLVARENFRREFIGNISHELKTPIFNIQGYMLTLLDGALDDPEINRKYLKRANKSVDRMINIIDDLEVISNLEAKRVQLSFSNFDIVELVKEVFELLESKAKAKNIELRFKKDYEKPIRVHADRPKVEQVIVNLVHNAIKYGRENGRVEVRFYDMYKQILTEVSDDGLGIPQEDIPRVFERFYRVDKSRSRDAGGTGLGLAIVKHIMEAHKQTINARSSEDVGSTFSFTLEKA